MSAENTALEVFGTKEVSVKEFMGSSDKSLVLLSDYEKAKANLEELKAKHQARVEELVAVEKLSPEENKELNSIRAELREPRYLIQNIEKNNISVFEAYKKTDKANLKGLIEINVGLEDKATEKLQLEEKRKKEEKELADKAEENRIAKIKSDIDNIETYCYQVIQKMTFENLKTSTDVVEQSLNGDYNFEEYDLLFEQVKDRVVKQLLDKTNDITSRENQRLENERMKQEIFDVRINRLKEVGVFAIENKNKNSALDYFFSDEEKSFQKSAGLIYNLTSSDFETLLLEVKSAKEEVQQAKRDAELKQQKDEQFEIRKNRLAEIGFNFVDDGFYYGLNTFLDPKLIYDADANNFEQRLKNAKLLIADIIKQKELADQKAKESQELELKAKEEADKKAAAEKKKADSENKARVKRLASDKKIISEAIKNVNVLLPIEEIKEKETIDFLEVIQLKINEFTSDLLTQLNEL